MCRARCITHQGRVISATGMHNHQPHMKGTYPNTEFVQSGTLANVSNNGNGISVSMRLPSVIPATISSTSATNSQSTCQTIIHLPVTSQREDMTSHHMGGETQSQEQNVHHSPPASQPPHQHHRSEHMSQSPSSSSLLQNMMQSEMSRNNLMNITNMVPILNPMQNHTHLTTHDMHSSQASNELHPTPSQGHENSQNLHSPDSPRNSMHHAQLVRAHMPVDVNQMPSNQSHSSGSMNAHQQHHHHHHQQQQQPTQSNESNDPSDALSSPNDTQLQHDQINPNSDPAVHLSLRNDINDSTNFKLEQI